jgi:hypothetical protein
MLNGSFQALTCHYPATLDRPFMAGLRHSRKTAFNPLATFKVFHLMTVAKQ